MIFNKKTYLQKNLKNCLKFNSKFRGLFFVGR